MRKINFNIDRKSPLLPPLKNIYKLMGEPYGINELALYTAKKEGIDIPINKKTLKKSEEKGISRKKALIVLDFLVKGSFRKKWFSFFSVGDRKLINTASKYKGNGTEWSIFLLNLEKNSIDTDFPKTKEFLKIRVQAEQHLFEECKKNNLNIKVIEGIYKKNFLIDESLIKKFVLKLCTEKESFNIDLSQSSINFLIRFYLDFFFWLLAYIENDLENAIKNYLDNKDRKKIEDEGIFLNILPKIDNGKYIPPIEQLFNRWRFAISTKVFKKNQIMSWSEFSTFLPDPINSNRKVTEINMDVINSNKYRELCSWRSGKVVPSDEKLQGFIDNLLPVCREREWWFWSTRIAVAINMLYFELRDDSVFEKCNIVDYFQLFENYRIEIKRRDIEWYHPSPL